MAFYGTEQGFTDWLAAHGLTLPPDAPSPAVLMQIGSSYVDAAYGYKLTCSQKTGGWDQELAWPRTGHVINGQTVPDTLVPQAWINASYRAAYLNSIQPGWSTEQVTPGRITKREKVDVIEREFFAPGETGGGGSAAPGMPSDAIINGLVTPWLCSQGRSANSLFRVV